MRHMDRLHVIQGSMKRLMIEDAILRCSKPYTTKSTLGVFMHRLCTDYAQTDQAEKSAFGLGFDATSRQKETVQDNIQS